MWKSRRKHTLSSAQRCILPATWAGLGNPLRYALRHLNQREALTQAAEFLQHLGAIMRGQAFLTFLPCLRCVQAEPDLPYPSCARTRNRKLLQVSLRCISCRVIVQWIVTRCPAMFFRMRS